MTLIATINDRVIIEYSMGKQKDKRSGSERLSSESFFKKHDGKHGIETRSVRIVGFSPERRASRWCASVCTDFRSVQSLRPELTAAFFRSSSQPTTLLLHSRVHQLQKFLRRVIRHGRSGVSTTFLFFSAPSIFLLQRH